MSQFHAFSVDGFPLTGTDEYGCEWTVEDAPGWYAGGGVRTSAEPKMQQNGSWRGVGYRDGRLITLRGKVFCPDSAAMELAARRLSSVLSSGGFGQLSGESPAGALSATVQLEDTPLFDPLSSDRAATWQLTVGSEDPYLYGPTGFAQTPLASSLPGTGLPLPLAFPLDFGVPEGPPPGSLFLPNAGTASYFPRLRIDGPVTNPVVTLLETGDTVRFNGSLAAGQHLDINWGTPRRVTVGDNPVSVRQKVSYSGNWLAVPPGGATISWSGSGSGSLWVWFYEGVYE